MFREVKKINYQSLILKIQSALDKPSVGTTFWWTLQEVTAANQERFYSCGHMFAKCPVLTFDF